MKFPWIVSILVATISFGLAAVGIATAQDEICPETPLWTHHDGSFEYGYSWQWTMTPPDLGSFAERFTGAGTVCGIQFYLTTTGFAAPDISLFVWASDSGSPGNVLSVLQGLHVSAPPFWPTCWGYDIEIYARVPNEFFVGIWPHSGDDIMSLASDLDSSPEDSWTKVPAGHQWAEGWHQLSEVWPDDAGALSIGVYKMPANSGLPNPTNASKLTWGSIKGLYK